MQTPTESTYPRFDRRLRGDAGSNLVEYAMLVALIVIVCLSALSFFGKNATNKVSCVQSAITTEVAATC